jgi:hypothetical protein
VRSFTTEGTEEYRDKLDVTKFDAIPGFVDGVVRDLGRLDVLRPAIQIRWRRQ